MSRFHVGQEASFSKQFSREDVLQFAELSGDNNAIHIDETYAKQTRFGANIVHGILVTGLISKVIGTDLPGMGSIYLGQDVKFKKPVYIGDKVTAQVTIKDIREDKKIFTLETNVYNQHAECVICGEAKVMYEGEI